MRIFITGDRFFKRHDPLQSNSIGAIQAYLSKCSVKSEEKNFLHNVCPGFTHIQFTLPLHEHFHPKKHHQKKLTTKGYFMHLLSQLPLFIY